jgi:hypothetical protein
MGETLLEVTRRRQYSKKTRERGRAAGVSFSFSRRAAKGEMMQFVKQEPTCLPGVEDTPQPGQ